MRDGERGFAAPLVIAAVALIALSVLLAAQVASDQRGRLVRSSEDAAREIAGASAVARAAFLLLTEPMGARGPVIGGDRTAVREGAENNAAGAPPIFALDSRPYRHAALIIEAQDAAGLVNLNSGDAPAIARLAALAGATPSAAERLGDALADYVDADDLTRQQGAEAAAYAPARARNAPISHVASVDGAYGWRTSDIRRDVVAANAAALPQAQTFNVNTAPEIALMAVLDINSRDAAYVIDARADRPFQSAEDLTARTGVRIDEGGAGVGAQPARIVRLTMRNVADARRASLAQEVWITLAPDDAMRPFGVRRRATVPVAALERDDGEPLPASSQLLAARER